MLDGFSMNHQYARDVANVWKAIVGDFTAVNCIRLGRQHKSQGLSEQIRPLSVVFSKISNKDAALRAAKNLKVFNTFK